MLEIAYPIKIGSNVLNILANTIPDKITTNNSFLFTKTDHQDFVKSKTAKYFFFPKLVNFSHRILYFSANLLIYSDIIHPHFFDDSLSLFIFTTKRSTLFARVFYSCFFDIHKLFNSYFRYNKMSILMSINLSS